MIILGWHGGIKREYEDMIPGWSTHDGAAVLMKDGEIIAAIEEERLNRVKHSNFFPTESIKFCLRYANIDLVDVDLIAMNFIERTREIFPADIGLPSVNLYLEDPARKNFSVRECICEVFHQEFDANVENKLFFCNHHIAHLWSAWSPSSFTNSLIVSVDGKGDNLSGMVALGRDGQLSILREFSVAQSLGRLYSDMIRFIGYKRFDEYKAMGLAPYGNPSRFRPIFKKFYRLLPEGEYELADEAKRWAYLHDANVLPEARRWGEPFQTIHKDFAAALQEMLETIYMHILEYFRIETQQENLCLVGGVAHNASLNGKILYEGGFKSVFVQPAAHDAGGALGAAIAAHQGNFHNHQTTKGLKDVFWGTDIGSNQDIKSSLDIWRKFLKYEKIDNVTHCVAKLLADGAVAGWVQGRSEFGPRALGHRSILADPRPIENNIRINSMVKKRESFRPFAPSICKEYMGELLDLPSTKTDYSYMTFVLRVQDSARSKLAAATHVDGTARIQSVSQTSEPKYWELIHEFGELTGVYALLNTSFNNNYEPIVDSVEDAIVCFLTTGIDVLVIGDYVIYKRNLKLSSSSYLSLRLSLPKSRKLVQRIRPNAQHTLVKSYYVEATASRHFIESQIELSKNLYLVLETSDGSKILGDLYRQVGVTEETAQQELTQKIIDLWFRHAVVLRP